MECPICYKRHRNFPIDCVRQWTRTQGSFKPWDKMYSYTHGPWPIATIRFFTQEGTP